MSDTLSTPLRDFAARLEFCYIRKGRLPAREHAFVTDLRKLWVSRADAEELGFKLWEPSVKQLNYLNRIYEML
jgi:hypothetical protein